MRFRFLLAALASTVIVSAFACGGGDTTMLTAAGTTSSGVTTGVGGMGGTGGMLPPPQQLKIMDWNTHNFFDTVKSSAGEDVLTATQYKTKIAGIGGTIAGLDPDIVMLAEVENQKVVDDLNMNALNSRYPNRVVIQGNDTRGINVGLMSKIAPDMVVSHKDEFFVKEGTNGPSYKYARDCLEVHLTYNGRKVVLLGVHFKAKTPPDDPDKRLAEAQHTRSIADALVMADPSLAVVILGDYNDTPGSAPVNAVAGQAPTLFTDAASFLPDAYSYVFNGEKQLIDHQMGNPLMSAMLEQGSVIIKHGAGIDDSSNSGSDHAPIYAVYDVQ